MDWNSVIKKFVKGTVGCAITVASGLVIVGQSVDYKVFLGALAAGAFHGAIQAAKELGWLDN